MDLSKLPDEIITERYSSQHTVRMVLESRNKQLAILLSSQFEMGIPHALKNKLYVLKMEEEAVIKLIDFHYVQEPVKE